MNAYLKFGEILPIVLNILSLNEILASIKGLKSSSNLRKITCNNPMLDLVNINAYIKLAEFCPFALKILSRNEFLA